MPQRSPGPGTHGSRARVGIVIGAAFLVTTAAAVTIALRPDAPGTEPGVVSAARPVAIERAALRERRPTLDPARFTGQAAAAYQVAREMPEVLDQLQCYCACGSQYGHVSLLSCYTDGHGST